MNIDKDCMIVENEETPQSSSKSYSGHQSSLAALAAHKVQVKKEKEQRQQLQQQHQHQQHHHYQGQQQQRLQSTPGSVGSGVGLDEDELDLLPKSFEDHNVLSHLRQMGFTDNREIMMGLRTVQRKRNPQHVHGGNTNSNSIGINLLVEETMLFIVVRTKGEFRLAMSSIVNFLECIID